jgi:preprotein translocase subunit YajC
MGLFVTLLLIIGLVVWFIIRHNPNQNKKLLENMRKVSTQDIMDERLDTE